MWSEPVDRELRSEADVQPLYGVTTMDRVIARSPDPGVNRVQAVVSRLFTVALDRSLIDAHAGAPSDAIRLRLLLGQRGGEVMGMRWDEVDLKAGVWHLPAARTKNGRPHSVPPALALLERRRGEAPADAGAVFPGLTQWSDDHRALSAIDARAYTWKDLRRTVSTRLATRGFSEEVIGRVLNHARYTVTARHYIKHGCQTEVRHARSLCQ